MNAPSSAERRSSRSRGQSLVLFALTMLLVVLMVCMTLSFGWTAARKADLNNVADATALSEAMATARTFNVAAILNRAMVAHYVAEAGITAQMVYATRGQQFFFEAGYQMRLYDFKASNGPITNYGQIEDVDNLEIGPWLIGGPGGCVTNESRAASYELWHGAYWFFKSHTGVYAGDNTNSACAPSGTCSSPRGWINPEGVAQLEEAAAKQAHAVHEAIWDLAEMQRNTIIELRKDIADDGYPKKIADQSGIDSVKFPGTPMGRTELAEATGSKDDLSRVEDPDSTRYHSWREPMGAAVQGSRPKSKPLFLPADGSPVPAAMKENLPPLWKDVLTIAKNGLAAKNPNFTVSMGIGDTSSDVTENADGSDPTQVEQPLSGPLDTGIRRLTARFREGAIATTYNDCRNVGLRRTASGARIVDPVSGLVMDLPPVASVILTTQGTGAHGGGGTHLLFGSPKGCHSTHEHYGAIIDADKEHGLANDEALFPLEALGFVLPDKRTTPDAKGARGAWGQPKLPVLVSQGRQPWKAHPFDLMIGLRFKNKGDFKMKDAPELLLSTAAGMAYYHRRGHLGEPPNLLNPFWHAALVPMEVDERSSRDPTEDSQRPTPAMIEALSSVPGYADQAAAQRAYKVLRKEIDGMEQAPGRR